MGQTFFLVGESIAVGRLVALIEELPFYRENLIGLDFGLSLILPSCYVLGICMCNLVLSLVEDP